ncbi:hypothetical protein JL721_8243 [Aureococcus anophagefferens]|nr:hypothetical protein JL721_8243 [Aureococcus anophagefferens]
MTKKKLQALKAGDGDAKAIAESEKRLRQLTEKMAKLGNTPDAAEEKKRRPVSRRGASRTCQRDGWKGHLERVRKDELAERKRQELEEDMRQEDLGWDKQTMDKLRGEGRPPRPRRLLGHRAGQVRDTGCSGYVQQRGAPRNIKPRTGADGNVECGVWSWNASTTSRARCCAAVRRTRGLDGG